jgi:hypothetical protein
MIKNMRHKLWAAALVAAALNLIVITSFSGPSHADVGTYCAAYSSQAAKRKTGLSEIPAGPAAKKTNAISASEPSPGQYPETPEGKWQQAYDKAFAGCMQNYAADPVTATASTDPGDELGDVETKPKADMQPVRKIKPRVEKRPVKKAKAKARPVKRAKVKVEEPPDKKVIATTEEPPLSVSPKQRRISRGSRAINPVVKKAASYCDSRPASDPGCKNKAQPVATTISIKPGSASEVPVSGH